MFISSNARWIKSASLSPLFGDKALSLVPGQETLFPPPPPWSVIFLKVISALFISVISKFPDPVLYVPTLELLVLTSSSTSKVSDAWRPEIEITVLSKFTVPSYVFVAVTVSGALVTLKVWVPPVNV